MMSTSFLFQGTVAARDGEIRSLKITQELQKKEEKKMKEQIGIYQVTDTRPLPK